MRLNFVSEMHQGQLPNYVITFALISTPDPFGASSMQVHILHACPGPHATCGTTRTSPAVAIEFHHSRDPPGVQSGFPFRATRYYVHPAAANLSSQGTYFHCFHTSHIPFSTASSPSASSTLLFWSWSRHWPDIPPRTAARPSNAPSAASHLNPRHYGLVQAQSHRAQGGA